MPSVPEKSSECDEDFSPIELVTIAKRLKQVPRREKRETQDRAQKVKEVTGAVLLAPVHAGKHMQSLAHVCEHD